MQSSYNLGSKIDFPIQIQRPTRETLLGFVNAFAPATQPLKQASQAPAEIDRKCYSQKLGRFLWWCSVLIWEHQAILETYVMKD